jgi:hypothetical protein
MRTPRLPAAAVWLLDAFNVTDNNPALIGDLAQERSAGRSSVWFWRQVLAAIGFAVGEEIYNHKLLTIRAVIAGEAAVLLSYFALIGALGSHWFAMFCISVFTPLRLPFLSDVWSLWLAKSMIVVVIVCMFGGWIVGRLHRDHRGTFVVLFAALQFIWTMVTPTLRRHLVDSIDQPRFRPYLALDLGILLLVPIAVLLGGYLAGKRAEDQSPMPRSLNG